MRLSRFESLRTANLKRETNHKWRERSSWHWRNKKFHKSGYVCFSFNNHLNLFTSILSLSLTHTHTHTRTKSFLTQAPSNNCPLELSNPIKLMVLFAVAASHKKDHFTLCFFPNSVTVRLFRCIFEAIGQRKPTGRT